MADTNFVYRIVKGIAIDIHILYTSMFLLPTLFTVKISSLTRSIFSARIGLVFVNSLVIKAASEHAILMWISGGIDSTMSSKMPLYENILNETCRWSILRNFRCKTNILPSQNLPSSPRGLRRKSLDKGVFLRLHPLPAVPSRQRPIETIGSLRFTTRQFDDPPSKQRIFL